MLGIVASFAACTAWLAWRGCDVIHSPSVQPTFVYFFWYSQPYILFTLGVNPLQPCLSLLCHLKQVSHHCWEDSLKGRNLFLGLFCFSKPKQTGWLKNRPSWQERQRWGCHATASWRHCGATWTSSLACDDIRLTFSRRSLSIKSIKCPQIINYLINVNSISIKNLFAIEFIVASPSFTHS